jgi:hypothetical protein
MSQHTPGPWQIEGKFQKSGSPRWGFIITAGTNDRHDGPAAHVGDLMVSEADARLIAAAPDLLDIAKQWAALDGGAWDVQRHAADKRDLLADTRAAIAKAEGADHNI